MINDLPGNLNFVHTSFVRAEQLIIQELLQKMAEERACVSQLRPTQLMNIYI